MSVLSKTFILFCVIFPDHQSFPLFCTSPIIKWLALLISFPDSRSPNFALIPYLHFYCQDFQKSNKPETIHWVWIYREYFSPLFLPALSEILNTIDHFILELLSFLGFRNTTTLLISFVSLWFLLLSVTSLVFFYLTSWVFFVFHAALSSYVSSFIATDWSTIFVLEKPRYIFFHPVISFVS